MNFAKKVLVTSIPPRLRGQVFSSEASSNLQNIAIKSWLESGFKPISFNTKAELDMHPVHAHELTQLGVMVVPLDSSVKGQANYLPSLSNALEYAVHNYHDSAIGVTNADIVFAPEIDIVNSYYNCFDEVCLLAHRTDCDSLPFIASSSSSVKTAQASVYFSGIDFVAATASSFKQILNYLSPELSFGLPWWDLYLPLSMLNIGKRLIHLDSRCFYHLRHFDRWSVEKWNSIGMCAASHFYLSLKNIGTSELLLRWLNDFEQTRSPAFAYNKNFRRQLNVFISIIKNKNNDECIDDRNLLLAKSIESLVCSPDRP